MSTKLDIFNRALAELGHNRTLTSTTSTTDIEAVRLSLAWDGAYKHVLAAHDWNWLVAETALTDGAECTEDGAHLGWYYWSRPQDYLRILAVVDARNKRVDYDVADQMVFAQVDSIRFRYLPDSPDPADWPHQIVEAVVYELAARVALPMSANGKAMTALKQLSAYAVSQAIFHDAAESRRGGTHDKYKNARR